MAHNPDEVVAAIRKVAADRIADAAAEVDRERRFPADNIAALGKAGGLGLFVPADHGGLGGSLGALVESCEAVGAACASTGMVFLMHSVSVATLVAGGGERASKVLRTMAAGHAIGTLAFSERGTGAHFYSPDIKVTRQPDGRLRTSGRKSFVTSGGHADVYLLLLAGRANGTADMYMVTSDEPGLQADGAWLGLGMAGNSSVALELNDIELIEDARVGTAGSGLELVFSAVAPFFLVGLGAVNTGIAGAAATAALDHVKKRRYPDGSRLAEVQYIQHLLADMDAAIRSARLLVREAARLGDAGDPAALVAIMEAKIVATEIAVQTTERALLATGGQGYRCRCRLSATFAMRVQAP